MSGNKNPFGFKSLFFQDLYKLCGYLFSIFMLAILILILYCVIGTAYDKYNLIETSKIKIAAKSKNLIQSYERAHSICKTDKSINKNSLLEKQQNFRKDNFLAKDQFEFADSYIYADPWGYSFANKSTLAALENLNCYIRKVWINVKKACDMELKNPRDFNTEVQMLVKEMQNDIDHKAHFWNYFRPLYGSTFKGEINRNSIYCTSLNEQIDERY